MKVIYKRGSDRAQRGGCWGDVGPAFLRAAYRDSHSPGYASSGLGLRIMRKL